MSVIQKLTPLNLNDEKEKFFADFTYNPQFSYAEVVTSAELIRWGAPKSKLIEFSRAALQQRPSLKIVRHPVENSFITDHCRQVIAEIGITEEIEVVFEKQKVTRCSVSGQKISFKDPAEFTDLQELEGTLNHELQTHLLRNLNQQKQDWKLDRATYDAQILRTEEGLAVLHSLLPLKDQTIWRPCAYYLAVALAQENGLADMFAELVQFGFDHQFAWKLCTRTKRGQSDTSQPGGNTKDLCYLEGVIQMWRWIKDPENDPRQLYFGNAGLKTPKMILDSSTSARSSLKN